MFLTLGFALKTLAFFTAISPYIVIHSFALGIGMITISMMSRVALGHTGRNVFQPHKAIFWLFLFLALSFVFRVILLLLLPQYYTLWVFIAQALWAVAFGIFVIIYSPMLFKKRLDGQWG